MSKINKIDYSIGKKIREDLQADCQNCFALCCTALNIVASSDFAMNKPAGIPCQNLQSDFSCQIHGTLREKGFKGCTVFDCLGAGQKVSQTTFHGQDWRQHPAHADAMFRVFPIMEQLFEMIAYIAEALSYKVDAQLYNRLLEQLEKLQFATELDAATLLKIDIPNYRMPVNMLLLETSTQIRQHFIKTATGKASRKYSYRGVDWMGKNLKGKDLRSTDLRGAYLIAANLQQADLRGVDFIGADLRDANLRGADLSTAMFLTQMQINSAQGDKLTQLPSHLKHPPHWLA